MSSECHPSTFLFVKSSYRDLWLTVDWHLFRAAILHSCRASEFGDDLLDVMPVEQTHGWMQAGVQQFAVISTRVSR